MHIKALCLLILPENTAAGSIELEVVFFLPSSIAPTLLSLLATFFHLSMSFPLA